MMESASPKKRKDIVLIVLSALDVITGILSLVITALAIQVIAVMASGLTLVKAIKVVIQSEKTVIFVKPIAVYAAQKIKRSDNMKGFFGNVKNNIKNNPITLVTGFVELVVCSGLGYALVGFFGGFAWAVGWKLYCAAYGAAAVAYAVILALTVYLGHDNAVFAAIRKVVGKIGGEKAVDALDRANKELEAALEAAKKAEAERLAEETRIAEQKAKDEEIYAKIVEEENRRKEAEKQAKIAAYKATHPEVR